VGISVTKMVIGLALTQVMTFLGGFLQATPFNFLNYIFFVALCIGGVELINMTLKSEATGMAMVVLCLTGISAILLFGLFVCYDWFRLAGNGDVEASIELLLYLVTLFFWILVIASLVLARKLDGHE
jgi:hypothetical protein